MGVIWGAMVVEECLERGKARQRASGGEGEQDRDQSDRRESGEGP